MSAEMFICDHTDLGEDGLELARRYDYDVVLLDILLPDISGFEFLRRLRSSGLSTPVIVLSGLGSMEDKLRGFRQGADDYLSKPFQAQELIARIKAIVRRSRGYAQSSLECGRLIINVESRFVTFAGKAIKLTGKEYAVLELLMLRRNSHVTKEMLLNHLYGGIDEPEMKIVDVFVCRLRRKLRQGSGGLNFITTVWGQGYRLENPEEVETQKKAAR